MVQSERIFLHGQLSGRQPRRNPCATVRGRCGSDWWPRVTRKRQVRMHHRPDGTKVELWEPMLWDEKTKVRDVQASTG